MSQSDSRCSEGADPVRGADERGERLRPAMLGTRWKPWISKLAGVAGGLAMGVAVSCALVWAHQAEYDHERRIMESAAPPPRSSPCLTGEVLRYRDGWLCCTSFDGLSGRCVGGGTLSLTGSVTIGSSLTDEHEIGDGRNLGRHGCGRLGRPGVCP